MKIGRVARSRRQHVLARREIGARNDRDLLVPRVGRQPSFLDRSRDEAQVRKAVEIVDAIEVRDREQRWKDPGRRAAVMGPTDEAPVELRSQLDQLGAECRKPAGHGEIGVHLPATLASSPSWMLRSVRNVLGENALGWISRPVRLSRKMMNVTKANEFRTRFSMRLRY